MTAYFIGDIPAEDLVIEPARNGEAIDVTPFTTATPTLRDPDGVIVTASFIATIVGTGVDATIVVQWPNANVLDTVGVYQLSLVLSGVGPQERLSPVRIVVEAVYDGWYTLDLARADWADAPDDDMTLSDLLTAAKSAVLEYGRALAEDELPPTNFRKAQLMHARTIWNADKGDSADQSMGLGGFVVTPKSLEKSTREVIRPRRGIPVVG